MFKIKNFRYKILITVCVLIFAAVLYLLPISCFFLSLTGIPCPGCGMTHALISALRLDFASAFSHHIMFWSVPILYICFLFDGRLFKAKAVNVVLYAIMAAGFAVNWIINIFS